MHVDLNEFSQKMPPFLDALKTRLDADNRGGKIIFAGTTQAHNLVGFDVHIEDKNGLVSKFFIDPLTNSWEPVY
ncbi:hypothetical protein VPHF86_0115 [Vibrio phage F86]